MVGFKAVGIDLREGRKFGFRRAMSFRGKSNVETKM